MWFHWLGGGMGGLANGEPRGRLEGGRRALSGISPLATLPPPCPPLAVALHQRPLLLSGRREPHDSLLLVPETSSFPRPLWTGVGTAPLLPAWGPQLSLEVLLTATQRAPALP